MTSWASLTSMIGIPAIGESGSFLAAGLVTSFAPITTATSVRGISGLISSISLSCSYGTSASASRTFMWAGIRMDREVDVHPALLELVGELLDRMLGLRNGHSVAGHEDHRVRVAELDRGVLRPDRV